MVYPQPHVLETRSGLDFYFDNHSKEKWKPELTMQPATLRTLLNPDTRTISLDHQRDIKELRNLGI